MNPRFFLSLYITYTKNIQALCCSGASECSVLPSGMPFPWSHSPWIQSHPLSLSFNGTSSVPLESTPSPSIFSISLAYFLHSIDCRLELFYSCTLVCLFVFTISLSSFLNIYFIFGWVGSLLWLMVSRAWAQ